MTNGTKAKPKVTAGRLAALGVAVFAVAFVIGILSGPTGFWNKVSAVLGPIGIVLVVASLALAVAQRLRSRRSLPRNELQGG